MKIISTIILVVISISSLQAENPTWRYSKRIYRESACNYKEKCEQYCTNNEPLPCECSVSPDSTYLNILWSLMWAYHQIASDEKVCKYDKKCYQYGYCPTCECDREMLLAVIEQLIEEEKNSVEL